jgi:hypothetical protein
MQVFARVLAGSIEELAPNIWVCFGGLRELLFRSDRDGDCLLTFATIFGGIVMLMTILLIVLILMLVGALPAWPYSRSWGYAPSGVLIVLLIIVIISISGGYI